MANFNVIFGNLGIFSQFNDYKEFRNDFLKQRENQNLYLNVPGAGRIHGDADRPEDRNPTLGYGFNLNGREMSNITAYFTHVFGTLSVLQQSALSILNDWKEGNSVIVNGVSRLLVAEDIVKGGRDEIPELSALTSLALTESQATVLLNAVLDGIPGSSLGTVEDGLSNALNGQWLQNSTERVALLSMYYQSPGLIGDGLRTALANNNRAEAWYQIRYGHLNYGDNGLQIRKNFESNLFKLTTTTSVDEYAEALSHLYTQRYYTIDQRDEHSPFEAAIAPLKTALQNAYTQQNGIDWVMSGNSGDNWFNVASDSSIGALVLGEEGSDTIYGDIGHDYLYGGAHGDSVDGGSGTDRLYGEHGADKLYGGGAAQEDGVTDYLYGGTGFDSYFVSHGDQVIDADGLGEVFFKQKLYGGVRHQGDSPGAYTSSGNHFTYYLSGTDLFVNFNSDNSTILIKNFDKNHNSLGIVLEDLEEGGGSTGGSGGGGTSTFNPTSFANTLKTSLHSAGQIANTPPPQSPLVFDLNNDGITLKTQAQSNAIFDLDGDGFATHISYIGSDDGFLALDANSDGIINDVTELFGFPFTNGFNKLALHDGNTDGKIDASDAVFSDLLVFRDINGDGVSQSNELTPLSLNNIASMSLTNTALSQSGEAYVAFRGTYTLANGETRELSDVMLTSDALHSRYVGNVTINPATENLPNIKARIQLRSA